MRGLSISPRVRRHFRAPTAWTLAVLFAALLCAGWVVQQQAEQRQLHQQMQQLQAHLQRSEIRDRDTLDQNDLPSAETSRRRVPTSFPAQRIRAGHMRAKATQYKEGRRSAQPMDVRLRREAFDSCTIEKRVTTTPPPPFF